MNSLYDLPGQSLRKKGEVLRLRQYGDAWRLTYKSKGVAGRHKVRTELETKIEDGGKMDAILHALGFTPTFRYEKFRAEWSDGRGQVVVDETPIGNFGEIEGSPRWIDKTARLLQLDPSQYITESYVVLFLAWKKRANNPANEMTFRAMRKRTQTLGE